MKSKIYLLIIFFLSIFIFIYKVYAKGKYELNIKKDLINMFNKNNCTVYINIGSGLGNRLMSVIGIVIMSIFFDSKPKCITASIFK